MLSGVEPFRLRDAREDDLDAMHAVKDAAGQAAWAHVIPRATIATFPFPERWRCAVRKPARRASARVAEMDGRVIGFALTRASEDADADAHVAQLDGFYVHPACWGLGAGRALLSEATHGMRADGFHAATLWTLRENERPRRIYERAGWRPDGVTRDCTLAGASFSEVRLRLVLRPTAR